MLLKLRAECRKLPPKRKKVICRLWSLKTETRKTDSTAGEAETEVTAVGVVVVTGTAAIEVTAKVDTGATAKAATEVTAKVDIEVTGTVEDTVAEVEAAVGTENIQTTAVETS